MFNDTIENQILGTTLILFSFFSITVAIYVNMLTTKNNDIDISI